MSDKAMELVEQAGTKVLEYIEDTEGFVLEQAPILAQEIVRFGFVSHLFYSTVILVVCLGGARLLWNKWGRFIKKRAESGYYNLTTIDEALTLRSFICIVIGALSLFSLIPMYWACMAYVAPRYYILQIVGDLVR